MGDNLRLVDLATLLAILAAVVLVIAALTPPSYVPVLGPLSVDEATTFVLDTPVVVSGYLVDRGARTYSRDAPRCAGVRLAVVGLQARRRPPASARPRRREWGRARSCPAAGRPAHRSVLNRQTAP